MNIQPVTASSDTAPVRAVDAPPTSTTTVVDVSPGGGPAATWWVSPPGRYFSVLHELAQRYPMELVSALESFAEGSAPSGAAPPDAATSAAIGSELAHTSPSVRRRDAPPAVSCARGGTVTTGPPPAPSIAPTAWLRQLFTTMQRLAHENASAFDAISVGLAESFGSVARAAAGPDASAMATLAAQLQLSAQLATLDRSRTAHASTSEPDPAPVQAVTPTERAVDDGSDARPPAPLLHRTQA